MVQNVSNLNNYTGNYGNYETNSVDGVNNAIDNKVNSPKVNNYLDKVAGKTFDDSNPRLEEPKRDISYKSLENLVGVGGSLSSVTAIIMATIQKSTSEMIRQNRDSNFEAQMQSAELIEEQANKMREQATVKFACAIVSQVINVGTSLLSTSIAVKGLNSGNEATKTLYSSVAQAVGQMGQSLSGMVSASGEFVSSNIDAEIKQLEADQKKIDAMVDQVKSITDSFQQLVSKSIETHQAIMQSMNETTRKVLV